MEPITSRNLKSCKLPISITQAHRDTFIQNTCKLRFVGSGFQNLL